MLGLLAVTWILSTLSARRPTTHYSTDRVLGYILQFDSIEALTRDIIEGKVATLSYEGFGKLEDWCQSKGIPLLVPQGKRDQVVELIATRNLVVHNRSVVDERFRKAVPCSKFLVGQERQIEVQDLEEATSLLDTIVRITDSAIAGKFVIEQPSLRKVIAKRAEERWPPPKEENVSLLPKDDPPPKEPASSVSGSVGSPKKPAGSGECAKKHQTEHRSPTA